MCWAFWRGSLCILGPMLCIMCVLVPMDACWIHFDCLLDSYKNPMGFLWDSYRNGILVESYWIRMGFPLGFAWDFRKISLGFLWGSEMIPMGLPYDSHGIPMRLLRIIIRILLASYWVPMGFPLGCLWGSHKIS